MDKNIYPFLLSKHIGMEGLYHIIDVSLTALEAAKLFSEVVRVLAPSHLHQHLVW